MINNVERHTPQEILDSHIKHFTKQFLEQTKAHEKLEEEKISNRKKAKKASTIRIKKSIKDSQAMKEKMAKIRAMKHK